MRVSVAPPLLYEGRSVWDHISDTQKFKSKILLISGRSLASPCLPGRTAHSARPTTITRNLDSGLKTFYFSGLLVVFSQSPKHPNHKILALGRPQLRFWILSDDWGSFFKEFHA